MKKSHRSVRKAQRTKRKWTKVVRKHFTEEETCVSDKHMRRGLLVTSQDCNEMPFYTLSIYRNQNVGEEVGDRISCLLLVGM